MFKEVPNFLINKSHFISTITNNNKI